MNLLSPIQYGAGIPKDTILMLLLLPIVATIVAFARQVIGIKSFSAYVAILTTFIFMQLGLGYGIVIAITVYLVGSLTRIISRNLGMHYIPRMSLMLTIISFTVLIIVLLSKYIHQFPSMPSAFPLLLLITLADTYISTQIQKGFKLTSYLFIYTIITSVIAYFIISWSALQNLILNYPEIVLATIILNLMIGRWSGLKVVEYWRFKSILHN